MKSVRGYSNYLALAIVFSIIWTVAAEGKEGKVEKCSSETEKRSENLYKNPQHLFDQTFGLALTPEDFLTPFMSLSSFSPFGFRDYFRPWRQLASMTRDVGSTIKADKDQFQINLDVQHFAPEEITVKAADGYVVIEAKHEEKEDEHGFISRQFVRRYALPEGTEPDKIVSNLSSDGVLTVTAPRKPVEHPGERVVPITRTGPVRKETKEAEQGSCQSESCNTKQ